MGQFNVAKAVLSFFGIVGWLLIGFGLFIALFSLVNGELALLMPGLALSVSGILTIATTQMGLAQITTAENTSAIYSLIQSNLSKKSNVASTSVNTSVNSTAQFNEGMRRADVRRIKIYKGREILKTNDGVAVGEKVFANVIEAEKWIAAQIDE